MSEFIAALTGRMGYDPSDEPATPEARERQAALATLLDIVRGSSAGGLAAVLAELDRRQAAEAAASGTGVTIATLHRAKGLEWDAVFVPGLETGHFPVKQAGKSAEQSAEERRLLYVGITRARRDLTISWASEREGKRQVRSPFLDTVDPQRSTVRTVSRTSASDAVAAAQADGSSSTLYDRLKVWRLEVARAEQVPAYVVFSNSTLALIARDRPGTEAELAAISGVGPAKLERYGSAVLAVVAAEPQ
jgi:DNA helicase-2/ATP-dependent DNA helicase PcrA